MDVVSPRRTLDEKTEGKKMSKFRLTESEGDQVAADSRGYGSRRGAV
jgi:hypothetical protein